MGSEFSPASLMGPLGILALVCLVITLTLGLLVKKNRRRLLPWHLRIGLITVIVAIVHGMLGLFLYY